jgi:hypothetical protein
MAKSLFFRNWLVLAVLLVPTLTTAQEVTEAVDSIKVDPNEDMIIETYYTDDGGTANDTIYLNDEANDWQKNLPQYCICVIANKNSLDASTSDLGDVINPLAKWLLKR